MQASRRQFFAFLQADMATAANALSRMLGLRSARLLCHRTLTRPIHRSLRSGSVFVATTRAVSSHKPSWLAPSACSQTCNCGLHKYTKVDNQLMTFLDKEIQHEKSQSEEVPLSKMFQVNVEGTQVTLERDYNGEKIAVSFDVNHNVNHDEGFYSDSEENNIQDGKIVSYPYFTVKIIKESGQTLKFDCEFNSAEPLDSEEDEELPETEPFTFLNVSVMESQDADVSKSIYEAETENMDQNLQLMLSSMLEDRGMDRKFATWLLDYSTTLEHHFYIKFLEDLQSFIKQQ